MSSDKYFRIYINDHLGGATVGYELAKRCASKNPDTPLEDTLVQLMGDIEEERELLRGCLAAVGGGEDRLKQAAGWVAEKIGRLKLNGELTQYSDLSRVLEIEGLLIGVEGKMALWHSLRHSGRFPELDLDRLIERAENRQAQLQQHHRDAVTRALGP